MIPEHNTNLARRRLRTTRAAALLAGSGLVLLVGCSSGSATTSPSASPPTGAANSGSAAGSSKHLQLAFFAFSQQNSYEAAEIAAAQAAAKSENASLTVFDGANNAQTQFGQVQDSIASGKYEGFLVDAVDGSGLVPVVKTALTKDIKVVAVNTVLGSDLSKQGPQIPGVSASVVYTGYSYGQHEGKLVAQACGAVSGQCQVGYMYDVKASGYDQGVRSGFNSVIASQPSIRVVAEGQDSFTATGGLASAQTMLQAHPSLNVIAGSDQGMEGADEAVAAVHRTGQVKIIGVGGSAAALKNVKDGSWFGDVVAIPATQGRLATQALVKAIRTGTDSGGINPALLMPAGGLATKASVTKFTGEWAG